MITIYFRDAGMWLAAIDELVDMGVEHSTSSWLRMAPGHTVADDRLELRDRYMIEIP